MEKTGRIRSTYAYPVQVLQFGNDLTLIALAGEVVVDYGLRLKREIAYEVPSDRSVPIAVNRGNPAVLSDAKADFSRALRGMAKGLVAAQAAAKQKKSFLATLSRT